MEVMSIWERFRNWLIGYNQPEVGGDELETAINDLISLGFEAVDQRDKWYSRYLTWRALAGKMRFQRNKARENTDHAMEALNRLSAAAAFSRQHYVTEIAFLRAQLREGAAREKDLHEQVEAWRDCDCYGHEYCGAV